MRRGRYARIQRFIEWGCWGIATIAILVAFFLMLRVIGG